MSANNQYPQHYALMNQTGMRPMHNMMPMGMQQQPYPYPPQMPIQNSPRNKQMVRPSPAMMMPSPYEGQMMNPYMNMPQNVPLQKSSISKSKTSISERQNPSAFPQQQFYPPQAQMNNQFMMNQGFMQSGYGMRPLAAINKSQNQVPQMSNFYQPPQPYMNANMPYQQDPVGYNVAAQQYRPQKIQSRPQKSTIPTLPMISNPQMMNEQMIGNQSIMNNGQMNPAAYGVFGQAGQALDRPISSQRSSRPSSASSQISSSGLRIPVHSTNFRTGNNTSAKVGRRTPVDKRSSLSTHERYMKNSRGSLAALGYETYDLEDWKRQKNRDGNMKLPAGLGHTETNEWKTKVLLNDNNT